jgi:hypothetical protein
MVDRMTGPRWLITMTLLKPLSSEVIAARDLVGAFKLGTPCDVLTRIATLDALAQWPDDASDMIDVVMDPAPEASVAR